MLHYLDGKVSVEVALPLSAVGGPEGAKRFSEAMGATAGEVPEVRSVRVYYY